MIFVLGALWSACSSVVGVSMDGVMLDRLKSASTNQHTGDSAPSIVIAPQTSAVQSALYAVKATSTFLAMTLGVVVYST